MKPDVSPGDLNVPQCINKIEKTVYDRIKVFGFTRHGRVLHRFVSEDISQMISFQCGQSFRQETHLLWVNIGIRVPECIERKFEVSCEKEYYHEYECNIRTRLGAVKNRDAEKERTFDLRDDFRKNTEDITDEILEHVLPVFDVLSSRQAIIEHRRDYPWFDLHNNHLIELEAAMIYGHLGDMENARKKFEAYYQSVVAERDNGMQYLDGHLNYLDQLRAKLCWDPL